MRTRTFSYFPFLFLAFRLVHPGSAAAQPLDFFQERIEVAVQGDFCVLKGIYYFKNVGSVPLEQSLYYPFIVNDSLPFPDSIVVQEMGGNRSVEYASSEKGVTFVIHIPPRAVGIYQVSYRQMTRFNFMEYILTTTADWNKPLDVAEYRVSIPQRYQMTQLSLSGAKREKRTGESIYYLRKEHYMPHANLVVRWQRSTQ
jgi:hypothetical protein